MSDEHHLLTADVAQVLLTGSGSVLCVRRSPDAVLTPGQLTLVGGPLKAGEPLDHAARRRTAEETGVRVDARHQEFFGLLHRHVPGGADRITAVFVAQSWTGEPHDTEPDTHGGLFWVSMENPPPNCHPHTATILQLLAEGPAYRALNWPSTEGSSL